MSYPLEKQRFYRAVSEDLKAKGQREQRRREKLQTSEINKGTHLPDGGKAGPATEET
jgi:hypothetical protein